MGFAGLQDFRVGSGFRVLGLWDLRVEGVCVCVCADRASMLTG